MAHGLFMSHGLVMPRGFLDRLRLGDGDRSTAFAALHQITQSDACSAVHSLTD